MNNVRIDLPLTVSRFLRAPTGCYRQSTLWCPSQYEEEWYHRSAWRDALARGGDPHGARLYGQDPARRPDGRAALGRGARRGVLSEDDGWPRPRGPLLVDARAAGHRRLQSREHLCAGARDRDWLHLLGPGPKRR